MRYLLDTHVAVWSAVDTHRLPPAIAGLLVSPDNDIYYSAVTLFEIAVKNAPGRRDRMPISVEQAEQFFAEIPYEFLSIEPRHASVLEGLPVFHHDPFDRMLVAQARANGMRLITRDGALGRYGDVVLAF